MATLAKNKKDVQTSSEDDEEEDSDSDDEPERSNRKEEVSHRNKRKYDAENVGNLLNTGQYKGGIVTGSGKKKKKTNYTRTLEQNAEDITDKTSSSISSKSNSVDRDTTKEVRVVIEKNTEMYKRHLRETGNMQDPIVLKELVRRNVTLTLFSKLKFITNESQLDRNGKIAERIMRDMNVRDGNKEGFWEVHRKFINGWLRVKRNNVITTLKDSFISKYDKMTTVITCIYNQQH